MIWSFEQSASDLTGTTPLSNSHNLGYISSVHNTHAMLYVKLYNKQERSGHIGDYAFMDFLSANYSDVSEMQADGDELNRCCAILGRNAPNSRVYVFMGVNAQEIAANWYNFR